MDGSCGGVADDGPGTALGQRGFDESEVRQPRLQVAIVRFGVRASAHVDQLTIKICTLSSDLHRLQTVQIRRKGADLGRGGR